MVLVGIGDQPNDAIEPVPPDRPNCMESEDKQVASIVSTSTPTKYWQGKFSLPVDLPPLHRNRIGLELRELLPLMEALIIIFMLEWITGVCSPDHPLDIYAAAPGKVVFTGMFPVPAHLVRKCNDD